MSLEFLEGRRLSVMWVLYYFWSGIWWEPIKVMQHCLKQLAWISVWFCLVRSTFLMGGTWSLCIISQAHRWALQKCLLDIVMCGTWQDKRIYEQSCLWAACRSHDMPVLVVTAQLCSTFVYECSLSSCPKSSRTSGSYWQQCCQCQHTRARREKRCFWLIVIAAVLNQQLIKLKHELMSLYFFKLAFVYWFCFAFYCIWLHCVQRS